MDATLARLLRARSSEDIDNLIMAARLRRERRLRVVMGFAGAFPTPATWRTLDLVHEATRLIDRLERRRADMEDAAAERYWLNVYAQQ